MSDTSHLILIRLKINIAKDIAPSQKIYDL
jgi:hypothetical protein